MSTNIVTALGPGDKLRSLSSFAPDYVDARRAFNNLLVFPYLEAIQVGDDTTNLLSLVTDGNSRFSNLTSIDITLARNVISYSSTFNVLVPELTIQLLVMTMQPVAQEYSDHARAQAEENHKFFSDFADYIATVNERITSMDDQLRKLDDQIKQQSAALADKSILNTLWEIFRTLFKLASTAEESDVQISAILGVTISTITGSFKNLFNDQARLQKIISSLEGLRARTEDLKNRFVALSKNLTTTTTSSKTLLDVWADVAGRMDSVKDNTSTVSETDAQTLTVAWAKVADDATKYINILQQPMSAITTSSVSSHQALATRFNALPKVPLTQSEIAFYKLAAAHGQDAPSLSGFVSAATPRASSDDATVEKVLGPPSDTQKKLNDLADSTGKIINQFNTLLQQPFLDQYKCISPIDESDSNLLTVMTYYRDKYLKLQLDTLPVARDLGSYAALQIALLPTVAPDNAAKPTDLPMSVFLATNTPLVAEYHKSAEELSERSTQVKNDWDNVVNLVKKLIAECDENITTWTNSVNDLTEQQKKMTMYACLAAFGAFIAFTAAVFLPGVGMLVALGAGTALGGLAVWQAIEASKIIEAINELKGSISNAQNTKGKLEGLLPFVNTIATSLSQVSLIWADITTALNTLNAFYNVLNGPTGPIVLNNLRPSIISNWKAVQDGVDKYIQAVST